MSAHEGPSRRSFLAGAAGLTAAAGLPASAEPARAAEGKGEGEDQLEPFWGAHQGGIVTPMQGHSFFAAFDLATDKRAEVAALLQRWTQAAARLAGGFPVEPIGDDRAAVPADSGEALGLPPARLTLTFGFGTTLFTKDGVDRFGLAAQRPAAFADLPKFAGDQLVPAQSGGDLSVQACADDPQTAFHAVRQLARIAGTTAQIRWAQTGFATNPGKETPRNLMGFKDGTNNPPAGDPAAMASIVWVGDEGPEWVRGGSYLVVRRIRIALEHWDRMKLAFQERTVGRHKYSGAPLGRANETDPLELEKTDANGNPLIPATSHVGLAAPAANQGAAMLRRGYSYNDGANLTAERWPPWHQAVEYDAGLFFLAYQRDPRTAFIPVFERMAKLDMMNQFVTHTGGGLFAMPAGVTQGEYVGQRLFEAV